MHKFIFQSRDMKFIMRLTWKELKSSRVVITVIFDGMITEWALIIRGRMSFNLALISQGEMKACGQWKRLPADYGCSAGLGENISAFHSDTYMSVPTREGFFFSASWPHFNTSNFNCRYLLNGPIHFKAIQTELVKALTSQMWKCSD